MRTIICLSDRLGDYGVYAQGTGERGPFGTPLLFRGTLAECMEWRRAN